MEHNRIIYERPYDSEVEYLEYDGHQYIDTGITPNETIEAEIKIVPTSIKDGSTGLLAARNNPQTTSVSLNINSLSLWVNGTKVALNDNNYDSGWVNDAMTYDTSAVLRISNRKLYVDDVLIKSSGKTNVFSFDVSYGLLRCKHINNAWDTRRGSSGRLYYTKIWKDETLVRDFIPVRVGSVGYMYDRVSGKLFGNKGTGNFILGQDVSNPVPNIRRVFRFNNKRFVMPMPYDSKIEYLESDGNQYIDTEIEATSNLSINIRMANHATAWTNINICGTIALNPMRRHHLAFDRNGTTYWFDNNNYSSYYKPDNDVVFSIIVDAVKKKLTINNYQTTLSSNTFATGNNYYLFARNGVIQYGKIRIYNTKMYNGTLLVRDFIPVRKGNIGYMYDKVSGRLFGNLGTGNFILGNDIN